MAVRPEGGGTLQQIVDSWRTPGLILRADTSAELVNTSLSVVTGLEQERLVGFGWLGSIHHADPGAAPVFWGTRMAAGEQFAAEVKLRRHDGSFHPVHVDATPLGDGRWLLTTSELQRPVPATSPRGSSDDALRALMFEHVREAAFAWELEGRPRIVLWNRAAERLYGYTVPEVVGRSPHVVLRTAFPLSLAHMEAALRRDGRWSGELRHTSRDGTILTIDASLELVRLGDGRAIVLESARDITTRRRDELATLEANARLRLALAATQMGIWEWHIASNRVYWSPEAQGLLGVEATGYAPTLDDFRRLVVPDDLARLWATVEGALAGEPGFDCEFRIVRGDGAVRWVHNKAIVDRDAAGAATRLVGTIRDIDDRKRIEAALRSSEEAARARADELATILEATPAAVWIARDPDARVVEGSRAGYEMLRSAAGRNLSKTGDDPEAVAHFSVWSGGVELAPHELPLQRAARGEVIHGFTEEIRFTDGTVQHVYGNAVPLHNPDGTLRGAVAAFIDVTPLRAAGAAGAERSKPRP